MDFAGIRSIDYYLTLPITPRIVFLSMGWAYALVGFFLSLVMLLVGKVLFFSSLHLGAICWWKLLAILLLQNLFYGFLALAIAAYVNKVEKIGNVWSRFVFPLWFMGGYQFSWLAVYKTFPYFSYVLLLNPVLYAMEGTRAALLGQEGYIPWWISCGLLAVFTYATWKIAYNRMKKLLDFV